MTDKSVRVVCPECQTSQLMHAQEGHLPRAGDHAMCDVCTAFLMFTDDTTCRLLTLDEIGDMPDDLRIALMRARADVQGRQRRAGSPLYRDAERAADEDEEITEAGTQQCPSCHVSFDVVLHLSHCQCPSCCMPLALGDDGALHVMTPDQWAAIPADCRAGMQLRIKAVAVRVLGLTL